MKTILFPTDFSSDAENALQYALGICNNVNAKLILFHSCHVPAYKSAQVPMDEDAEEQLINMAENNLLNIKNKVKLDYKNLDVESEVNYGLAVDNIVSIAKEKHSDLIVMGTKGASGMKEVLIGSNASHVLENAHCPVLVIPENAKFKKIEKIVFATNFRESDFQSIEFLSEVASSFSSEILIIHISQVAPTEDYESNVIEWFKEELKKRTKVESKNISFHVLIGGNVDFELEEFIEKNNADILSLSMRKRTVFSKLFDRSLTKKMAYHSHVPVLAFHASKGKI